mmetsp:Transcript_21587/g.50369  ORF Transcript_21587/g.50369 Transcript_21587/m.50369 type:complete len:235 (-) Transcript_21587:1294-1998(-)
MERSKKTSKCQAPIAKSGSNAFWLVFRSDPGGEGGCFLRCRWHRRSIRTTTGSTIRRNSSAIAPACILSCNCDLFLPRAVRFRCHAALRCTTSQSPLPHAAANCTAYSAKGLQATAIRNRTPKCDARPLRRKALRATITIPSGTETKGSSLRNASRYARMSRCFVPSAKTRVSGASVSKAMRRYRRSVSVLLYFVWYPNFWPNATAPASSPRARAKTNCPKVALESMLIRLTLP